MRPVRTILARTSIENFQSIHPASDSGVTIGPDVKEKSMPNDFENRVLVRTNARQLSDEEFQEIMEKGKAQMTQLPSIPFNPDF